MVSTENGPAIGTVAKKVHTVPDEQLSANLKNVIRMASDEDLLTCENNRQMERDAMQFCTRKIAERQLQMKLIEVECLFDQSKMIFSFTAENRVDFRDLVKDLVQVPDPHRTSADRCATGGSHHQGARDLRTGGLLRDAPAESGPRVGQDGQGAEHVPQPPKRSPASADG